MEAPRCNSDDEVEAVVTGLGVISPAGRGLGVLWSALDQGITLARMMDAPGGQRCVACSVPDLDEAATFGEKRARRLDRGAKLALLAGADAVLDAQLEVREPQRVAIAVGTAYSGLAILDEEAPRLARGRVNPLLVPLIMPNATPAALALTLGWTGPAVAVTTGCAAGIDALETGRRFLQRGWAEAVLVGAVDTIICRSAVDGFDSIGLRARSTDEPGHLSRPFDRSREGLVLGEGAAFMVLETAARAQERNAFVYARVRGFGNAQPASPKLAAGGDVASQLRCMEMACSEAGVAPRDLGYISSSANSTPLGDRCEARTISTLLSEDVRSVPVTSTLGALGFAGAASAVLAAAGICLSFHEGRVPPTANFTAHDENVELSVVRQTQPLRARTALCNGFGVAGPSTSIVLAAA